MDFVKIKKENFEIVWEQSVLPILSKLVSSIGFSTYITDLTPVDIQGNKIILLTPRAIVKSAVDNAVIGDKIAEAIEKCKKGVVIINTSRGALVDAEALLSGIKSRKVGAACLDVYEEESDLFFEDNSGHILEDDTLARLISMPNVIVTSHQAFLTEEALENIAETTVGNLRQIFDTSSCPNELCYRGGVAEDCKSGKCF